MLEAKRRAQEEVLDLIKGKKILYIATKNEDYIRIQQEIKLLENHADEVTTIVSDNKKYLSRVLFVYKKLLATSVKEYDVIYVSFMAQMIVPFWKLKFRGKTLIVDFFISIYDTLVDDRKKVTDHSLVARVLHKIDEWTVKPARYVISDTRVHGTYFRDEFKIPSESLRTLYLEADTSYYHPMNLKRPEEWKDKFLVLYFGSILPVQGVEVILEAIDLLKEEKDIHFIMIGPINKKYEKVQSSTVTYIDWLKQEDLARYIAYADLCLAGHFSGTVGKANRTIAGKTYIYQAMGKAVVLGDSEANRELFGDDNYFVARGSARKLAEIVSDIFARNVSLKQRSRGYPEKEEHNK